MRAAARTAPDLFGATLAPAQVRVPPRPPQPEPPRPASAAEARLEQCLAAHRLLTHAQATARDLEQRMARGPASPNEHAARRAAHAATLLGGAVLALADALLLNGGTAHDALLPDEEDTAA